ncbi:beta-ketoacyl-[acyl-carrier-protein] synthase family protein [Streptomyces xanthophaeus]|uniref:beta-ketoacyl-[acyl-carrier-protein] synthase family protein n=1 Tax=Streptomyces xanthophaeus TaxID=67385 RepID=UPI0004CDCC5D|nr:beta-ketoacyl-[acyl-carrier-protein] synthase family protein [Streptomyces xanthophaeus]
MRATRSPADVVVTGLGVVAGTGVGQDALWEGLLKGTGTATTDPDLAGLPVGISCAVPDFDVKKLLGPRLALRVDPFVQHALVAAEEAVRDAGLALGGWDSARIGVVLGVGSNSLHGYETAYSRLLEGRPGRISPFALPRSVPNMAAGEVSLHMGIRGPAFTVAAACASGAMAMGVARDLLRGGTCDIVLTGGAESGRSRMTVANFHRMGALAQPATAPNAACRPFDEHRSGFVVAEGAGVLVLERAADARARKAPVRALLAGHGATSDAHHPIQPHPGARGVVAAMQQALRDAGVAPGDIGHVNAHGTGTELGDLAEAHALQQIFGEPGPPVTASKGVLGHCLGAAGAIEAIGAVLAMRHGLVPPTANLERPDPRIGLDLVQDRARGVARGPVLSNSIGFGGHNVSLVLLPA